MADQRAASEEKLQEALKAVKAVHFEEVLDLKLEFKQILMNSEKLTKINEDPQRTLRDKLQNYDPVADLLA